MTGAQHLGEALRLLAHAGVPDAARDARRLLAHALDLSPARLTLALPDPLPPEVAERFHALVARRAAREPVSHLTGRRAFYGRDFHVTPDVLDPRPETETLIGAALGRRFARVLDLGTGSGCILLTLLAERRQAKGLGTDLSDPALAVAQRNAAALGLTPRARFAQGSWWDAVDPEARFDLIVSNPPYIAQDELPGLAPEVLDHEPRMALTDDADGLSAYRVLAAGAPRHLAAGGALMVEIGPLQGDAVAGLFAAAGLCDIAVLADLDGRSRVVSGRLQAV
ncbi:peptide chain release factor N(5)-glutamine methyltransferase [Salipiger manganoxidans]|uniref:peptide chain release factor N(5)-glutamine methyltransferase n=1 Tax=Salipiger marinus TaxID=555512 RepID=UPI001E2E4244|nr:peptide chain release factor N(5)-glutamine methyltransferase [Salipiger manganoxidans]MCD1620547.1 peptide chain release factor N(5)-glutamine methyltransferase [Salipiger manganoxidans]